MEISYSALELEAVQEVLELADEADLYVKSHQREFQPVWYDWQKEGFDALESHVMTMAGNQTGKTWSTGFHTACDLTGDYPDWWQGFRFEIQIDATALGVDTEQLIDVWQPVLFGTLDPHTGKFSGGWVHADEIEHVERSQVQGLAKRVYVKSRYGTSKISLRSYTQAKTGQGTLKFAGTKKDLILPDECPPDELVGQLVMRTVNGNRGKGGRLRYTMTPELGATQLVTGFMENLQPGQKLIGPVAWDECTHMTPEKRAIVLAGVPEHEHDMRSKGVPFFGSGLVFPIAESRISVEPFDLTPYHWWKCIRAIDLGIDHPTALIWMVWNPEDDCIYLVKTYAVRGENAATHAAAANKYMPHAPMVFPHDIENREKGSGKTVRKYYEEAGITNGIDFENIDGSRYVEPGLIELLDRMRNGTFKVFSDCTEFWREFRLFHRKDGKLVDMNNDVIAATRYGAIMIPRMGTSMTARYGRRKVRKAMR